MSNYETLLEFKKKVMLDVHKDFCDTTVRSRHALQTVRVSPEEVSADRAEGGLAEEGGGELMVLNDVKLGLLESSSPPVEGHSSIFRCNLH